MSIYGWRGAKIENIHQFSVDYENVLTVRLEQNYRSTGNILAAANALIEHNEGRLGKNLWTRDKDGDPIYVYSAFNDLDEARFVVGQVVKWVAEGGKTLRNGSVVPGKRPIEDLGGGAAVARYPLPGARRFAIL